MSYWLSKVCDILVQTTFNAPDNFMFKYTGQTPDLQLYPSDKTSSVGIGKSVKDDVTVAAIVDSGYSGFTFDNIGFD